MDTHVFRIAHRLKLSNATQPLDTEQDLLKIYPREYWGPINHQWVLFGRQVCTARNPSCETCFLADICPSFGKAETTPKKRAAKGKKPTKKATARSKK